MVTVGVGRAIVSGMVIVTRSSSVTVGITVPVAVIVLVAIIVTWLFTTFIARANPISAKKIVKGPPASICPCWRWLLPIS